MRLPTPFVLAALTVFGPSFAAHAGSSVPVALAWSTDGRLLVAERERSTIAVVDASDWTVAARHSLPIRPHSLAVLGTSIAVGGEDGEFLIMDASGKVSHTARAGRGPANVIALDPGRIAFAPRWDNTVLVLNPADGSVLSRHEIGFEPGAMARLPDGRLCVADAFRGRLAVIGFQNGGRPNTTMLDGANLHALGVSGDGKELLVGQMVPFGPSPITASNIDWGVVISSKLTAIRLTEMGRQPGDGEHRPHVRRLTLDGSGHGAADPSAIAVARGGVMVLVALGGAHKVLVVDRSLGAKTSADLLPLGDSQLLESVDVGRTPVALAVDPTDRFVISADSMSDTLSVISLDDRKVVKTLHLSPESRPSTAVLRGEALFHDGRASLDSWMSCASCHAAGHTNGLNFDTQGDGGYGAPKNVPSLLGAEATAPYTWTGHVASLEDQARESLQTSLRGPGLASEELNDLVAYVSSLAPPPALRTQDDPTVVRGRAVFAERGCDACHRPPSYTSHRSRDVGLNDGAGRHYAFNPPSLRGVARSAPYFHDGRARNLDEALKLHHPGDESPLEEKDRLDLAAFLESL